MGSRVKEATMAIELRGTVTLIEVADVTASIEFYRDALGFNLVDSAGVGDYVGGPGLDRETSS